MRNPHLRERERDREREGRKKEKRGKRKNKKREKRKIKKKKKKKLVTHRHYSSIADCRKKSNEIFSSIFINLMFV